MVSKLQKDNKGFTIIEVLIVLAIAGLIMLIVFLAIPALQRNQRNTQRRNDASAVATAANTVSSNSNGNLPKQVYPGDGNTPSDNAVSLRPSATITTSETVRLGHYKTATTGTWGTAAGNVFVGDYTGSATLTPTVVAPTATPSVSSINRESMTIAVGYGCNDSNTGVGAKAPRSIAVLYVNETAGGNGSLQCAS